MNQLICIDCLTYLLHPVAKADDVHKFGAAHTIIYWGKPLSNLIQKNDFH